VTYKHAEPEIVHGENQIDLKRDMKQFASNVDRLLESKVRSRSFLCSHSDSLSSLNQIV